MKKMKYWILIALAVVIVGGLSAVTLDHQLKASDGDGTSTAAEQQAEAQVQETVVEIAVPAVVEEPAPVVEEPKAEEPAPVVEEP